MPRRQSAQRAMLDYIIRGAYGPNARADWGRLGYGYVAVVTIDNGPLGKAEYLPTKGTSPANALDNLARQLINPDKSQVTGR